MLNVEAERQRQGMTKREVADFLGVRVSVYQHWTGTVNNIPGSKLVQLALLWDTTTDYLLDLTNSRHRSMR